MFGTVNMLLVLTLLFCPYVCLGQQARGGCENPSCRDACEIGLAQEIESDNDCGCCHDKTAADPEPLPVNHTPAPPKTPNQCLCEGALAGAVSRPSEFNLASLLPAAESSLCATSPSCFHFGQFENAASPFGNQTGRDVCLTLCALLL